MPTRLVRLKREARKAAKRRGHRLGRFGTKGGRRPATASCLNKGCSALVTVEPYRGYEIVGDAVAVDCPATDARRAP